MQRELRMWRIYGAVSTLALVVIAVSGFTMARQKASFGTIDVQRINVVEPDGTVRMVISDKTRFPGAIGRPNWRCAAIARADFLSQQVSRIFQSCSDVVGRNVIFPLDLLKRHSAGKTSSRARSRAPFHHICT